MSPERARILLVDDSPAIHADFAKVLHAHGPATGALERERAALFGEAPAEDAGRARQTFEVVSAFGGSEALDCLRSATTTGRPFSVAFVDMKMPGGWDGVRTIEALWAEDPELQVVLCTAYRERTWQDVQRRLGPSDRLLLLKKPFDGIEVLQLACALSHKATLGRASRRERDELAAQVAERTAELSAANRALMDQMLECRRAENEARSTAEVLRETHEELAETHAQVQAATMAKSEFLANLSHEIRTPMTAILGYADLLRDPGLSLAERREQLDVITRSGRHLLGILSDILDLSTLEAGRMRVQRIACSPGSLLADLCSSLRVPASEKGLQLEVVFEGPVPASIQTDPARLRQLLSHLIENAIKFTDTGGVRLAARLAAQTEDGRPKLEIEVTDSGIGMDPDRIERLFSPFEQADGSASRRHGGTGLGLAIARRLAEKLGGDIEVQSEPGRGSRFTVRIDPGPLEGVRMLRDVHEAVVAESRTEPEAAPPAPARPVLADRRVLLAEDGRDNQLLLSFFLRKAGAEVQVAADGSKALRLAVEALASGQPYHVIVTDMQMPGIDGYELASRLRSAGYRAPIVALTAQALPGDREKCLAAGCNDYLSKPVDRERLIAVCAQLAEAGPGLGHTTIRPVPNLTPPVEVDQGPPPPLPRRPAPHDNGAAGQAPRVDEARRTYGF